MQATREQANVAYPVESKKRQKKNYRLWKQNLHHPGVEFKKRKTNSVVYFVVGVLLV